MRTLAGCGGVQSPRMHARQRCPFVQAFEGPTAAAGGPAPFASAPPSQAEWGDISVAGSVGPTYQGPREQMLHTPLVGPHDGAGQQLGASSTNSSSDGPPAWQGPPAHAWGARPRHAWSSQPSTTAARSAATKTSSSVPGSLRVGTGSDWRSNGALHELGAHALPKFLLAGDLFAAAWTGCTICPLCARCANA
jgi:hypothetical protein